MLFFMLFFVTVATAITLMIARNVSSDVYTLNSISASKIAYITAESALEDVVYRTIAGGYTLESVETLQLQGSASTTISYDASSDTYLFRSVGEVGVARRVSVVELTLGQGSAFNYGVQSGNGGFSLSNNASVDGNVFSNGIITKPGGGNATIYGDAISAGSTGVISRLNITGSTRSNTLGQNTTVSGDAYYNVDEGSNTVSGTRNTPYVTDSPAPLPISESEIDEWQSQIEATGTVIPASACSSGTYVISSPETLENVKIECDLLIDGATVYLRGPVWVVGDITLSGNKTIYAHPSLGRFSVQMIADNPANRLTSSRIMLTNQSTFYGSGHSSSYVMMLSRNESNATGGSETAIDIANQTNGAVIFYSNGGLVDIGNNIDLKTVTGNTIEISNGSSVSYETGLANTHFTGGPGGGYVIAAWYQE